MIATLWSELGAYSILELLAVLASLVYIVLAARNNRYCWPAAFVGSTIFVVVLWQYRLLMDSALNAYYAMMAIYGWLVWSRGADSNKLLTSATTKAALQDQPRAQPIQRWPLAWHALALALVIALSLLSGYWLAHNTEAAFPYLDSLTTWASLLATWMIARRVLENWLYWLAIDALSIYLYINKALYFTSALFIVYIAMAAYGYIYWRHQYRSERAARIENNNANTSNTDPTLSNYAAG